MKKIFLLATLFSFLQTENSSAQCPGCAINMAYTQPGIYPNPMPDGTQGQPYDQDITFVMFTDTSGFTVNYFKILSVSGLPFGLQWQCNASANGCQYDPSVSIYGCVKVCGTPLSVGTFNVNVDVVANFPFPVGDQFSTINIGITILPAAGGNASFTYTPASACDSAIVQFDALITAPPNPMTYNWDFGNGNTGTNMNETQNYNSPGDYEVFLQTQILDYIITDFSVGSVNDNWCGDIEEPYIFVCTGSPDLFFVVTDASSNVIYTSSTQNDVNSASWSGLSISAANQPLSITIWDYDPVSVNDNLGTFSFNFTGTGSYPYSGAGGTGGSLTVGTQVVTTFLDSAVVTIYPSPSTPVISLSGNDTLCAGDNVILTTTNPDNDHIQWYQNGIPMVDDTLTQITVSSSDTFSVSLTNANGCDKFSAEKIITVLPALPTVTFQIIADTIHCFLTQYSMQWYLNGNPIPSATGPYFVINETGDYHIVVSDAFGCTASSDTYHLTFNLSPTIADAVQLNLFPVPAKDELQVSVSGWHSNNALISVTDLNGRILFTKTYYFENKIDAMKKMVLPLENLSSGFYFLKIQSDTQLANRKILVQN